MAYSYDSALALFWEEYFGNICKNGENHKKELEGIVCYIRDNKEVFNDFVNAVMLLMNKKSDFSRTKETIQENFRNWIAIHKTVFPTREYIIILYYIYSLHTKEPGIAEKCNKTLNFLNFSPLAKRSLSDYLFEIGMTYKIDYKTIYDIKKMYSGVEMKRPEKKIIRKFSTDNYRHDLECSTTIALKKALQDDIDNERAKECIISIVEKYKYSFSAYSNIRRLVALKLIRRIADKFNLGNLDVLESKIEQLFSASFGSANIIMKKEEPVNVKLAARINSGKRNITRQGLVILAIVSDMHDIDDINNLLIRCDFEILDSSFSKFDYLIFELLRHRIAHINDFSKIFSDYLDAFYKSSAYKQAEDKDAFYRANFPIRYDCMTTKGI